MALWTHDTWLFSNVKNSLDTIQTLFEEKIIRANRFKPAWPFWFLMELISIYFTIFFCVDWNSKIRSPLFEILVCRLHDSFPYSRPLVLVVVLEPAKWYIVYCWNDQSQFVSTRNKFLALLCLVIGYVSVYSLYSYFTYFIIVMWFFFNQLLL